MAKVSIVGSGSFGCALSVVLGDNGHDITMWSYLEEEKDELITYHACSKLPGVRLPLNIKHTTDMAEAVKDADLIVMAVPSITTRNVSKQLSALVPKGARIISVSKGIEEDTFLTQYEIIKSEIPGAEVGVLCGPTHAEEVARRLPTVIVAGAEKKDFALYVQEIFMNSVFRVYISPDVIGMELGSSLKNVIALAAGMAEGLGFGDNSMAAIITRGIKEISTLAQAMGAKPETLAGLCGVGDLIVTCASRHSRNRKAGILIGEGYSVDEAVKKVNMVVEGIYSAKSAYMLGQKYGIFMPITDQVYKVVFEGQSAKDAVSLLMEREKKQELEGLSWD